MAAAVDCTFASMQGLSQVWNCKRKRFACRTDTVTRKAISSAFLPMRSGGLCSSSSWIGGGTGAFSPLTQLRVSATGAQERKVSAGHRAARSKNGCPLNAFPVVALSSSFESENYSNDNRGGTLSSSPVEGDQPPSREPSKHVANPQTLGILAAILGIGTLAALALTFRSGGSTALLSSISKSGFPAAFSLIFVSEIGDKTFFIAALLAMRRNKWLVLTGATGALAVMSVISVIIGKLFQNVPAQLQTTVPVGEYAAVALLIWFGLRAIKTAWDTPSSPSDVREGSKEGELAEARAYLKQTDVKKTDSPLEFLGEVFTLIFVAEWGDRSMLATIALGAAQSPFGVALGATFGHLLATLLAVLGGAFLARYLSEKVLGYLGGFLFLAFAAATLAGVF